MINLFSASKVDMQCGLTLEVINLLSYLMLIAHC